MADRITIELDRDDVEWLHALLVMKGHKHGLVALACRKALAEFKAVSELSGRTGDNERMELRDVIAQALRDFDYGHGVGKGDGWEWEDAADLIIERTKHHENIDGGGYSSCCECGQEWPCSYSGITRWPTIITGVHQRQCEYTLPMDGGHPFTKDGFVYEGKTIDRFTWPDGVVTKALVTTVEDGHSEAYGDERRVAIEEVIE